jgi:predicted GNAT family acetyltransferase
MAAALFFNLQVNVNIIHCYISSSAKKKATISILQYTVTQYRRNARDGWDTYAACTPTRYQELLYVEHLREKEPEADPKERGEEQWRWT